jgi:hypothetical protein
MYDESDKKWSQDDMMTLLKLTLKHTVFFSFLKRELERTVDLILQPFKFYFILASMRVYDRTTV